jgi:hypothetical protein
MTPESSSNGTKVPPPEYIENLLRQLQPKPSPRLYKRLDNAPWQPRSGLHLLRRWGFAMTLLGCLILACFLLSPPLRAMARNWMLYFLPDNQDQIELSIEQLDPQELYQYATPGNFPYSVEQVSILAGYRVSLPAALLPGMVLIGGRYESATQTTVLLYQGAGYNLFLSQRPIKAGQEYFSIGASAVVEPVVIGDIQGEYVAGGWVKLSSIPTAEQSAPNELRVEWDETLPQYTLRWQYQDFAYQLRSTGISSPHKSDLITLVEAIR